MLRPFWYILRLRLLTNGLKIPIINTWTNKREQKNERHGGNKSSSIPLRSECLLNTETPLKLKLRITRLLVTGMEIFLVHDPQKWWDRVKGYVLIVSYSQTIGSWKVIFPPNLTPPFVSSSRIYFRFELECVLSGRKLPSVAPILKAII